VIEKMNGHPGGIPKTGGHPAGIPKTGGHPPGIPKIGGMGHPLQAAKAKARALTSKTDAISRVPFFEKLSPTDIVNVEPFFQEYKFEKNQYLFWEGDPANRMYVIKSGRVRLLKASASGKEMVLEVMVPGQICGGGALFADTHRNSAQAVESTVAYGLSHESYGQLLSKYPEIARGIIKYLGVKLMDAHDVIISLVSSKVESRIASVIVRLCENHGTHTKDGILINIRLTRGDIADIVGSTIETTIRTISKFQKKGFLSTVSGRLLIKDFDAFVSMMRSPR
jgi:CRP/FNR family transcriptional regulator